MCTAIAGALFLKEDLTVKQICASCMCALTIASLSRSRSKTSLVFSFAGVLLIARPPFLFGQQEEDAQAGGGEGAKVVTPAQRMGAVGCVSQFYQRVLLDNLACTLVLRSWELSVLLVLVSILVCAQT